MTRAEFMTKWGQFPEHRKYCFYCGVLLAPLKPNKINGRTKDHLHPKSKGGGLRIHNVVQACVVCNTGKGSFSLEEYREWYGMSFFSELVLGCEYPSEDQTIDGQNLTPSLKETFKKMIDTWYSKSRNLIDKKMEGRHLTKKLTNICDNAKLTLPEEMRQCKQLKS